MVADRVTAHFEPGDVVAYLPETPDGKIYKCEIGVVKRVSREYGTAFVAYGCGDTCASTPLGLLMRAENGYAIEGLAERRRQLGAPVWPLSDGCEDWGVDG